MKPFANPPVAPQIVVTAVTPPPSRPLVEAGEGKSDVAGSSTEDPTKIEIEQSVVAAMIPPTTTPPVGLISETRNVDESTVSTVDGPKVVVEGVEPAMTTVGTRNDYYWDEETAPGCTIRRGTNSFFG